MPRPMWALLRLKPSCGRPPGCAATCDGWDRWRHMFSHLELNKHFDSPSSKVWFWQVGRDMRWFLSGASDVMRSSFDMYNLERQLWYLHLLTKHCPYNLLREPSSPKHEYRGKLWGQPVMSSMTSSPWKIFLGIIWDDLFISDVKWKLCLIFQNFQNGRHFELATNFLTGSYTGSWIYQKDSHEHFGHFELLIDAVAQILTEIYQFKNLTYFVTWWLYQWRHEYVFT